MSNLTAFDLDHTLIRGNVSFLFGAHLFRRKQIALLPMIACVGLYLAHKLFGLSMVTLHREALKRLFLGVSADQMRGEVSIFLDRSFDKFLYPPAVTALRTAQRAGSKVVLLSNSPDFLVEAVAKRLGSDAWRASEYRVDSQGRLCGLVHVLQGRDKARDLIAFARGWAIPRNAITAYSDSFLDIPFLEAAGHAVAVNPDRHLRAYSRTKNWPII